jgi:hypothetical protein
MIKKEWWLAAGAVSAAMSGQNVAAQDAPDRAGVAAAVNPNASGQLSGGPSRVMVVASDVFRDEHIVTDAGGQVHLLFLDESALTVGPNSEVILDKFVYDPQTNTGQLALTATRGAMRFIGGKLSKVNPIEIHTQTATIGVRGGSLTLYDLVPSGGFKAILLIGEAIFRDRAGNLATTLTRPGSFIEFNGSAFSDAVIAGSQQIRRASDLMKGAPKGDRRLVTAAERAVSEGNAGKPPGETAPHKIERGLSAADDTSVHGPSAYSGVPNSNTFQLNANSIFNANDPNSNYP